jgi:hypothetical protein
MRTISADYDALLSAFASGTAKRCRVQIKDSGGTFRDLTTYAGPDFVVNAGWGENIDSNGHDCTISVKRANEKLSISPFMQASPINRAFVYPGTFSPLVDLAREVKVEWSIAPYGSAPSYVIGFHGFVDAFNPANSDGTMRFTARGQYALPLDAFVEVERIYAHSVDADATRGFLSYVTGATYAVNQLAVPSEAKRNVHFYKVTSITTGIGGTEGAWPTGAASTVTFGGVTFTEQGVTTTATGTPVETVLQQLLNDNLTSPPTITTAISPSWNIRVYQQQRTATWTAMRSLVDQIGWDLRFRWNDGLADYRLELYEPPRTKTIPDRTFAPGGRYRLNRLETKLDGIRNVIRVIYLDSQDLDARGFPKRKVLEVSDSTSIARYGRRFMEVEEARTSNIDTSAEATIFANAMLKDLKDPVAELEVEMPFFPFAELGDLYRFSADGIHFDTDQDLAVISYAHSMSGGDKPKATTTVTCRGKPSGGYTRWLTQDAGRNSEVHDLVPNNALSTSLSTIDVVGGTKLTAESVFSRHALPAGYEFHVSPTPGFTPTDLTLVQQGVGSEIVIGDLTGGQTYYAQVIPFHFNASKIVRGQPSTEQTFVAGQANTDKLRSNPKWGRQPLNGGFEQFSDVNKPPDHWTVVTGTWATGDVRIATDTISGDRAIKLLQNGVAYDFRSDGFQVEQGRFYQFSWYVRVADVTDPKTAFFEAYMKTFSDEACTTEIDDFPLDTVSTAIDTGLGNAAWMRRGAVFQILSNGDKYAKVGIRRTAVGTSVDTRIDSLQVSEQDKIVIGEQEDSYSAGASTTSATFVDFGAAANLQQESQEVGSGSPGNDLVVLFTTTLFVTVPNTAGEFVARLTDLNGTTFDTTPQCLFFNNANVHQTFVGIWNIPRPKGVNYGASHLNVKILWRRSGGLGTLTLDANDSSSLVVF